MIERPRRAVTRFFVPLIDVLILLFCIFLLMPFTSAPAPVESEDPSKPFERADPTPLPETVTELQRELERTRRELKRLTEGKGDLAQRVAARVLQVDPKSGRLYYYHEGERREITDEREARRLIDLHKRESGTREPFFVLVRPENSTRPTLGDLEQYKRWFRDVPHQFE